MASITKILEKDIGLEGIMLELTTFRFRHIAGAAIHKNSLGLFSIRERMKQIGGSFEIQSKQNFGTMVKLTAPERELVQTGNSSV